MDPIGVLTVLFTYVLIPLIIILIVLGVKRKKKAKWAKEYAERQEQERLKAEEKARELAQAKEKMMSNETVIAWASDIAEIFASKIEQTPHYDHIFDLKTYREELVIGVALHDVYLPHTKKYIHARNFSVYKVYNFAQNSLPSLSSEKLEMFSEVVALLVRESLDKKGIAVNLRQTWRFQTDSGCNASFDNNGNPEAYYSIQYSRPVVKGDW